MNKENVRYVVVVLLVCILVVLGLVQLRKTEMFDGEVGMDEIGLTVEDSQLFNEVAR